MEALLRTDQWERIRRYRFGSEKNACGALDADGSFLCTRKCTDRSRCRSKSKKKSGVAKSALKVSNVQMPLVVVVEWALLTAKMFVKFPFALSSSHRQENVNCDMCSSDRLSEGKMCSEKC